MGVDRGWDVGRIAGALFWGCVILVLGLRRGGLLALAAALLLLSGCSDRSWNSPYAAQEAGENVLYGAFSERPKHLDPARAYSSDEYRFIGQIYEPPLQYHYLKRPYVLVPLTAQALPEVRLLDAEGGLLPEDAAEDVVAFSEYRLRIRPGILFQPHPAFARDEQGRLLYHDLSPEQVEAVHSLADFEQVGTRELSAQDYVFQVKRLADPRVHSPIYSLMAEKIVGLRALHDRLVADRKAGIEKPLEAYDLEGVKALGPLEYSIRLRGRYAQFKYWLAMPFFAPMPAEAVAFYQQPGLAQRNITLDWFPVGSGPFWLAENNPNRRMVLARNPNFRGMAYPSVGSAGDEQAGLLADAGRVMPFIDRAVYSLEKESIPYWTKFLQGYYDASAISSDSFDQAVSVGSGGDLGLTESMREKDIRLVTSVATSVSYFGFNMLDPVVGNQAKDANDRESARKLRQAIAVGLDFGELVEIFANGRGVDAQGPLPPGIFGVREGKAGINPYVFDWRDGRPARKPLSVAKALLAQAGYPGGIDPKSGKPLILYYDAIGGAGPEQKARFDWYRKQFKRMGLDLVVRATDYNRFREKMSNGSAQLFSWGWNADYPDPENFFFLLDSRQGKVKFRGENAANFSNPKFDALFDEMKDLPNGPQRQAIIDQMLDLVRREAPWAGGYYPKDYSLHHAWLKNVKPNLMAHNTLMYRRVDAAAREQARALWNRPVLWPLLVAVALLLGLVGYLVWYWQRLQSRPLRPSQSLDLVDSFEDTLAGIRAADLTKGRSGEGL